MCFRAGARGGEKVRRKKEVRETCSHMRIQRLCLPVARSQPAEETQGLGTWKVEALAPPAPNRGVGDSLGTRWLVGGGAGSLLFGQCPCRVQGLRGWEKEGASPRKLNRRVGHAEWPGCQRPDWVSGGCQSLKIRSRSLWPPVACHHRPLSANPLPPLSLPPPIPFLDVSPRADDGDAGH